MYKQLLICFVFALLSMPVNSVISYYRGFEDSKTKAIACLDMHHVEKCIRGGDENK